MNDDRLTMRMTLILAGQMLGTTPDNLRGAIRRGSLHATKEGRDWFVTLEEIERYQRENRRHAASSTSESP